MDAQKKKVYLGHMFFANNFLYKVQKSYTTAKQKFSWMY